MISYHSYPCLLVENYSKTVGCQLTTFTQDAWMNARMSEAFGCKKSLIERYVGNMRQPLYVRSKPYGCRPNREKLFNLDGLSVAYEAAVALLPHLGREYPLPAEEDDNDSVISVASSNDPPRTEQEDTDTDDSQPSGTDRGTNGSEVTTDEDMSDEESEDDFELSETDQRYLQEAYDNFSHYASPWIQMVKQGYFDYRAPFADASHAQEKFDQLINLPDSWPLMRILARIIACVATELVATHQAPHTQNKFVKRVAKNLQLS